MTDKNVNTEIRKEFCPNCEAEVPCTHEAELYVCDICGEDFAKYIVSRNCALPDVSMTQDVLTDVKTGQSIENTNPDYYKQEIDRLTASLHYANTVCMEQKHVIDRLNAGRRWIPVSEKLPETGFIGLCQVAGNGYVIARYAPYDSKEGWTSDEIGYCEVTHYMPLPPAPEGEGD